MPSSVITPQKSLIILDSRHSRSIVTLGAILYRDVTTIYNPPFLTCMKLTPLIQNIGGFSAFVFFTFLKNSSLVPVGMSPRKSRFMIVSPRCERIYNYDIIKMKANLTRAQKEA